MKKDNPFHLTLHQLLELAFQVEKEIQHGLSQDNTLLSCLPIYLDAASIPQEGKALALDLGGSKLRAAIVSLKAGVASLAEKPLIIDMPWERSISFSQEAFLNIHAQLLKSLHPAENLPLGYCFSYPAQPTPDGDARLLHWTKEVFVPHMEGELVGKTLLEYLHAHSSLQCSRITVVNDTVTTLVSGLHQHNIQQQHHIGLIVGTGTNMGMMVDAEDIAKMPFTRGKIPVNIESGNIIPPVTTVYDEMVDAQSTTPGKQRFEKAVAGAYLGRLFQAVYPQSPIDSELGALTLLPFLEDDSRASYPPEQRDIARQIYRRSAKLVAASLAGLIKYLLDVRMLPQISITAEGGLFWGQIKGEQYYASLVQSTLQKLLSMTDLHSTTCSFQKCSYSSLLGSGQFALVPHGSLI